MTKHRQIHCFDKNWDSERYYALYSLFLNSGCNMNELYYASINQNKNKLMAILCVIAYDTIYNVFPKDIAIKSCYLITKYLNRLPCFKIFIHPICTQVSFISFFTPSHHSSIEHIAWRQNFPFHLTVHPRMHAYLTPIKQRLVSYKQNYMCMCTGTAAREEDDDWLHGLVRFSRWIINWPQRGRDPGHS